ncbi:MAG: sugar transferase, partial [Pseudomonadota bacterium]
MLISPFPLRRSVPLAAQYAGATLYRTRAKEALDIASALIVLPLVLPFILLFAVLVRRDGGPAFFGHRRIGRNGRPFTCWKLRTMVPDAEAVLAAHLAAH